MQVVVNVYGTATVPVCVTVDVDVGGVAVEIVAVYEDGPQYVDVDVDGWNYQH